MKSTKLFFCIGAVMIIISTLILGIYIPKLNKKIDKAYDDKFSQESLLNDELLNWRQFSNSNHMGLVTKNFLIMLEAIGKTNTKQYDKYESSLKNHYVESLFYLKFGVLGFNVDEKTKNEWMALTFKELESLKEKFFNLSNQEIKVRIAQKKILDKIYKNKKDYASFTTFLSNLFQVFGLLFLFYAELIKKEKD